MGALVVVLVLFILAVLSPKLFPNKMISNNKHDIEGTTKSER